MAIAILIAAGASLSILLSGSEEDPQDLVTRRVPSRATPQEKQDLSDQGASSKPLPEGLPPEVLAAIEGRGEAKPIEVAPFPVRVEARPAPEAPPQDRAAVDPGLNPPPSPAEDEPSSDVSLEERERRRLWVDRQHRRDALRVEVLKTELGVAADAAAKAGDALRDFVERKVALYEEITEEPNPGVLGPLLANLRQELEDRLVAALGRETYALYKKLDDEGRFVLPDEIKSPGP